MFEGKNKTCYILHMGLRKAQTFGERVTALRRERGWTQQALADKVGIDQPFMSKIEADKFDPGMKLVSSVAKAFGVTLSKLLQGVK
jgi:putative transcriptional regulator